MEQDSFHQEPVVYEKPKKRRLLTLLLLAAAVLSVSSVLYLFNIPAIRVERFNGGFTVLYGDAAKEAPKTPFSASAPTPEAAVPYPHTAPEPIFTRDTVILQEFVRNTFPGAKIEEVPLQARIYFDLPEGIYIRAVLRGSFAAKSGLRPGDIVTSVSSTTAPDSPVTMTIFRDGLTYDLIILSN